VPDGAPVPTPAGAHVRVLFRQVVTPHVVGKAGSTESDTLSVVVSRDSTGHWLVSQLLAVPLRPLLLRPAFTAMKKRLWPFILTALLVGLFGLVGLLMCFFPGVYVIANFALAGPVVMMEDLRGRAAMKRSRALYKRSRRTVIAIVLIHIGAPFLAQTIVALLLVAIAKALKPDLDLHANSIVTMSQQVVNLPITILFSSFASVVTALLYWKTRLAGGETMKQALLQFAAEDEPADRGQTRPRTRARTSMRSGRSSQNRER